MYRYKTIRSPPITNNVTFELKDETIVLRIIVDAKNVQLDFDISTENENIDILKKINHRGDLFMPKYEVYLEMYNGVHI